MVAGLLHSQAPGHDLWLQFLPWAFGEYPLGQDVKLAGPEDIMSGFSHVIVDPLRVNNLLYTGREGGI